ncbi:MAG: hypothetical protein ACD_62C00207G0001, partial [uncultured bacterium]
MEDERPVFCYSGSRFFSFRAHLKTMFVTKKHDLSRNEEDKQKARRRVRHATL